MLEVFLLLIYRFLFKTVNNFSIILIGKILNVFIMILAEKEDIIIKGNALIIRSTLWSSSKNKD